MDGTRGAAPEAASEALPEVLLEGTPEAALEPPEAFLDLARLAEDAQGRLGVRVRPARVSFYPYAGGRSTVRDRGGHLHFRLSDRLQAAPPLVLSGVMQVLASKLLRVPASRVDREAVRAYKEHTLSWNEEQEVGGNGSRTRRSRKHIEPVGTHRSLLESYLRVSLDLGLVLPEIPKLSWSKTVSRHRFGHWDPDHKAIVLSQVLDDPRVPEFVLDYVLYHELLHVIHPVRMGSGTKRRVHTPEFRKAERRFARWQEGEEWIAKLASRRWRPLS